MATLLILLKCKETLANFSQMIRLCHYVVSQSNLNVVPFTDVFASYACRIVQVTLWSSFQNERKLITNCITVFGLEFC